jgi:hypothetical protein
MGRGVTGCIPAKSHEGLWIQRRMEHFGHVEVGGFDTWTQHLRHLALASCWTFKLMDSRNRDVVGGF